ncbi:transglutaminase domain-containing protein [Pseudoalteromonas aurantia]|uniref:Transglutaminase-like domain-containing protein n=1 Tax=Pseudoalteromonas aurantia 208 TaxID=1314867 RepID=A0ABR9E639_9GAMM|nr:transglutaminase domain-containing protein [Pseudoalteromonas aurantia]MBE0366411.1 hypothetical protein [Pseudoalteromonas aurantia 208]
MNKYYKQQTSVTDPSRWSTYFDELPNDIMSLIGILDNQIAHYKVDILDKGISLPPERSHEVDSRYAKNMLRAIVTHCDDSLLTSKLRAQRLFGTCRDGGVLLCSILRHKGIACRLRYGFTHFGMDTTKPLLDHIFVQYWCDVTSRWKTCDPRLSEEKMHRFNIRGCDPTDLADEQFYTAGQAWLKVNHDIKAARAFSGLRLDGAIGLCLIRNLMMQDASSLLGREPLMWDAWGYALRERFGQAPSEPFELSQLDKLAKLCTSYDIDIQALERFVYEDVNLRLPQLIRCSSPLNGDYLYAPNNRCIDEIIAGIPEEGRCHYAIA